MKEFDSAYDQIEDNLRFTGVKRQVRLLVGSLILVSRAVFADAIISYDDHNGAPNAGVYSPGDSFTFDVTITGTNTGTIPLSSMGEFDLWLATTAAGSHLFRITSDVFPASSPFAVHNGTLDPNGELISSGNASNLGGQAPTPDGWLGPPGVDDGSYFVAAITIQIDPNIAPGTYSIFNTTSRAETSGVWSGLSSPSGSQNFAPFSQTPYTITIVPEPEIRSLFALGSLVSVLLAFTRRNCER